MPENIHYTDFADNIREYYPNFKEGNNDFELVQNFLAQYPQYRGGISFDVKPSKGKGKTTPAQTQAPSNRIDLFQGAQDVPPYLQQIGTGISRSAQQVPKFADTRIDAALQYSNKFARKKGEPEITRENITPQNILDYTTYNIKKSVAGSEGPSTRINAVTAANDIYFGNLSKMASEKYGIDLDELINSEDPIEQDYVQAADMSSQLKLLAEQYRNAGDMATYKDFTQQAGLLDEYTGELSKDPNLSRRISAKAEFFPKIEGMAKDSKLSVDAIRTEATIKKLASDAMDYGAVPTKFAKEIARDYIGGTMYWVADLFGSDKVKNFVLNSPILSKDPLYQDELFMSPKEPGKDIQWDRVPGFVYKQTLNMIPAIAGGMALGPAAGTALANVAGVARGTAAAANIVRGTTVGARMLGTALTTYDDAIYELDQAASKSGAYISPSQKSMLASAATIKTAAIESLNPLDRAFKGGLVKNFAESAVKALSTGRGFRYAMINGANALTQAAKVGGLEIGEELLDETVQRGINSYSNEVLKLEGTPGVLKEDLPTLEEYADITINTLIATTPFMGAGAISASSNFRNDAFHSVSRQGLADKFLLKMEENIDQIGAKKFKAISNELQKVNNAYKGIPKEYDEDAARAIADKSIQIEELKDQLNGAPSQVIKDKIKAKIQSLENEILDIDATQEQAVAKGEQPPVYSPGQTTLAASDQEDENVLRIVSERVEPILEPLTQRMTNAEEIDMNEIESVAEQMIDEQSRILESETLSETEKSALSQLIELQINNLLNYEFATITTTEQAGEKTKTASLVATPREGRPLPESVVSRDRFDGAGVRIGGRGAGRITIKRIPGFGGRSVYGISFGNRKGVNPVENLEFDNLEFVASEVLGDGSLNVRVKDSKSGLEFTITDPELSMDLAIAAQLKEAGRKEFPQPAFIEVVREVTQGQPTQVTTFPNLGRTGTTPAAVGVEPQTEQDVRQETNAPQEGRAQGENAAPVPQEEGRQEGQVAPTAVEQEGETPPATEQKAPTTEEAIKGMAKSAKSAESLAKELEKALNAMKVKIDKGAAREATFMIPALIYNSAIDAAILAVKAGKTVVDAVNVAVKYINENFDGEWDKGGFLEKLSVDLTKPMESYVLYKNAKAAGREPVVGQKVGVRFNLSVLDYGRKGVLSVHDKTFNGDVIDMVKASTVNNVKFSASKSGAKKIKEGESNKFPMASVDGSFVSNDVDESVVENGQRIFFNPKITDFFYDKDGREVLSASRATVDGPKVFAEGLKYGDRVVDLTQQQAQAETKATRKAKTVFHSGTLEGKGNIYVSPIREQANEYSSMSGAPVLEFEINENAMAPESEVRDLIRSLGLKLPEGYNLDELFLYEALDTRVKSSLSQGDIDKLYTALKDKGYEGIAFRDEDIRGVKREGIDNFIVFDKSSLREQQAPLKSGENTGLSRRLSGNALLNAQDLLEELSNNGAEIDEDGNVTVYHRTSSEKKLQIEESGKMTGLENGVFFSTRETGQAEGYGKAIVKLKVPVEELQIDDVFGNEAHVRIPTSRAGQKIDVSNYLQPSETQQQAQPEAQVEATAKALDGVDTQPLKRQLGIEANWDMIGEGDVISGKDPVLAYIQKQLPSWNRESQRGNINPNSKITYDIVRGEYGGIDQKDVVEAKDENGVVIGVVKLDAKGGIENIAVAPEFRGKGVSDKLIQTLKANNPQLDLSKTKLRSKGFEKAFGNKIIAEAYHKAKADGSNPELVQAVEDLLGKTTPEAKLEKTTAEQRKEGVKSAAQKAAKSFNNWATGGGNKLGIANLPEQDAERFAQLVKDIGVLAEALVENGMTRAETALRAIKPYFETNYSEWLRLANVYFKSEFNLALIQKYPEVYKRGQKLQKEFDKTLKQRDALLAKDIEEAKAEIIGKIKSRLNPSNWTTKTKGKLAKTRLTPESISDLKAYSKLFTDDDLSEMDPKMLKELYKEIDQIYKSGRRSQIANNKVLNEQARNLRQRSVISVGKSLGLTESVSSYEIAKKKAQRPGVRFYIMLNSDPNVIQEVDRKDIDSWKDFFGAKGFTTIAIDVNANTSSKQKGLLGKLRSGINTIAINNFFDTRNIMALLANDEDAFNMFEKNFIDLIYKSDFERDELKNTIGRFDSIAQKLKKSGYDIGEKQKSIVLRLGDNNAEQTSKDGLTIGQIIDVFMMLRDPDALVRAGGEGLVNYNQEDIDKIIDYVLSNKPVLDAVEEVTAKYQDVLQEYVLPTLSTFGYDLEKFNTRTYNTNGSFSKNDVENARAIEILNKVYSNNIPQSVPYSPLSVFSGEEMIGKDYDVTKPESEEKAISVLSNNVISRIGGGQLQFGNVASKYNNYMNGMIDMVTRMPVLHNAQAIFNKDVSRLIENKLGESATKAIKNNINRVVSNRLKVSEEESMINPTMSNWLNRAVLGQMFLNTRSAIFQPIATLNYAAVAPDLEEYVKSTARMLSPNNFVETAKEISNQAWVKERFGGKIFSIDAKELDERTKNDQPSYWTVVDQLLRAGYTLTAAGDLASILVGGSPLYDSVKNKKYNEYIKVMSEKDAEAQSIKDASLALYKATNESQQSSNNLLISNSQKNPAIRFFLSFTTANQQLLRRALLAGQMMKLGVGSPQRNAYTILQFGMVNAALFTLISRTPELLFGLFDDDEEDLKKKERKNALKNKYVDDVIGGLMSGLGLPGVLLYNSIRGLMPDAVGEEKFDKVTNPEMFYTFSNNFSKSISSSAPAFSIKLRQIEDAIKAAEKGEYAKSLANAISFGSGIPTARAYDLFGQAAESSARNYTGMERVLRATDIYNKGWAQKHYEEQVLRGKTPALSKIEEKEIKDKNTRELNELMRDLGFRAASKNEAGLKADLEKVKKYSEYAAKNYSLTKDQYETLVENFNRGYFAGTLPKEFVDYGRMSSQTKVEEIAKKINSFENDLERQEYLLKLDSANANQTLFSASEVKRIKELIE